MRKAGRETGDPADVYRRRKRSRDSSDYRDRNSASDKLGRANTLRSDQVNGRRKGRRWSKNPTNRLKVEGWPLLRLARGDRSDRKVRVGSKPDQQARPTQITQLPRRPLPHGIACGTLLLDQFAFDGTDQGSRAGNGSRHRRAWKHQLRNRTLTDSLVQVDVPTDVAFRMWKIQFCL